MKADRKKDSDDVADWYLGFMTHFTDYLDDHMDDEDQRPTLRKVNEFIEEYEEMAPYLPEKIQAETALEMFSECTRMSKGCMSNPDGSGQLTERCSELFIDRVKMLKKNEKELFAHRVATMFNGHFGSLLFERMLTCLVGPANIGDVLETIRIGLFYQFRDSDDIMEAVDCRYREFAERLI